MENKKPIILTFVRYYLPGYKSGGLVRSIANTVDHLGDEFDFNIITADRDSGDTKPYPNIAVDAWNTVGNAKVYYASPGIRSLNRLVKLASATPHDLVYFNSVFAPVFTLWPLLNRNLRRIPSRPVVLAPRGEFSEGALALKRWKKIPYVTGARMLNFHRDVIWQASSQYEAEDIRRMLGSIARKIVIAPDLPSVVGDSGATNYMRSQGPLRVVFLSRIVPMKNLDFALRVLRHVSAPVEFNIYGPKEVKDYWRQCQTLITSLPEHIRVTYPGEVEHSKVASIMASHDLLLLPTRGENYGHVIAEALSAGTPVLIADTTPWRNLKQAGVGWDLPLTAEQPYAECIDYCAGLDPTAYLDWRVHVRRFVRERLVDPRLIEASRLLFMEAAGKGIGEIV